MSTPHERKYKTKYLLLKRRMHAMTGGDDAIRTLLRDKLARLDMATCDPEEMGDAARVLGRIKDRLAKLLAKDHFEPADVTYADALRGRLDRVFKTQPKTDAAVAIHEELLDTVGTTQDLVRRFVCREQPLARLPEDTTEAPPLDATTADADIALAAAPASPDAASSGEEGVAEGDAAEEERGEREEVE